MKTKLVILGGLIILMGCKASGPASSGVADYSNYSENLQSSLPSYPDYSEQIASLNSPKENSNLAIDDRLAQLRMETVRANESEPYFDGFSVLVYSGISRTDAFKAQEDLETFFPELKSRMQYEQPRYLLKVGQYIHRIEAQRNYSLIKETFPMARIIQDRIQRKDFQIQKATDDYAEGEN